MQSSSETIQRAIDRTLPYISQHIDKARQHAFSSLDLSEEVLKTEKKTSGKVRDIFFSTDILVLVCTDRLSGFDRHLAAIPFKGQVLNMTSAWWFKQAKEKLDIDNAVLDVPDPNVTVAKRCQPFPIEFVVRGYMTGSTSTSIWKNYSAGMRRYCGVDLPDGIVKNQRLPMGNILTPTTKDDLHDELISPDEIVSRGFMTQADYDTCAELALKLFDFGQKVAAERGLILVDTKYEFGKDTATGKVLLIDEVHTPDSSRYWVKDTYDALLAQGKDPENIDKEFIRKWYSENCDPYGTDPLPAAPADLVNELSRRYVMLYEIITGETFQFPEPRDVQGRVREHVEAFLKNRKQ